MSDDEDGAAKRRYMRWTGELQDAYLDALERCGGLHEARPKTLLDMLQPRFPYLTLQNVKNHLQKQRTREAKAATGGLGRRGSFSRRSGDEEEDLDDADPMDSGNGPASGGNAGPAPPRGAPAIWLSDSWAGPLCDATGVAPSNLIDLAKRALALTVHQLALYRKLLGELEQHEEDHTLLVAALREDPSGQTIVLEAQRVAAAGGGMSAGLSAGPGSVLTGTTSGAGGEEARSLRLRRLLARLLPPNPFSSGPKAEAAMKLAAWMAAVSRDADGGSVSAGSHLGGAGDVPPGSRRAAAAAHDGPMRAASGRQGGAGVEEMEAEGAQPRRRSKRHKPLSELLAEIPLQEPLRAPAAAPAPGVPSLPGQAAAPPPPPPAAADQLQQLLLGTGAGLGGDVGGDPLGGALSLLLQQHLSGEQAQAAQAAMEMDDDSLMLRALDAQMSSLLLQSVSNALLRSAQEGGDMPMDAAPAPAGGSGGAAPMEGTAPGAAAGAPSGFDAAAALAAAGQLQLPAHFQDAVAAALGDDPLSTAAVDISVLRSFLDMLSSGGITPLPSGQLQGGGGSGPVAAAAEAAAAPAVHDPAHVPPLSVAAAGAGGSGSGSGGIGGAFSAFKPTGSGSGGSGGAATGGGLGSGGAKPDS